MKCIVLGIATLYYIIKQTSFAVIRVCIHKAIHRRKVFLNLRFLWLPVWYYMSANQMSILESETALEWSRCLKSYSIFFFCKSIKTWNLYHILLTGLCSETQGACRRTVSSRLVLNRKFPLPRSQSMSSTLSKWPPTVTLCSQLSVVCNIASCL